MFTDEQSYRPGYNPQFLAKVREKQKFQRERAEREAKAQQMKAAREAMNRPKPARSAADALRFEQIRTANQQLDEANRVLLELRGKSSRFSFTIIQRRLCAAMGVTREEIRSEARTRRIVLCRQAISYWCRRLAGMTLPEIGYRMGGFDHSTIHHGVREYPKKRALMGRFVRVLPRSDYHKAK